jgi:hypothetical protein
MRYTGKLGLNAALFAILFVILICWAASPIPAPAQCSGSQGNNAVYAPCGTGGAINPQGSSAYIDASMFNTSSDICSRIHAALAAIPSGVTGAVIDARGISASLTCPTGKTPWVYTSTVTTPAAILLPAQTILLNTGWTLPSRTRIVGVGGGANTGSTGVTTIQACKSGITGCSNFTGALVAMGSVSTSFCPSNVCNGISVEDLWLDGQGQNVVGIANSFASEGSYVKHVTLNQLVGAGLSITAPSGAGSAQNSGPYQDITVAPGSGATTGTICARILNVSTRGIHGMSCINTSSTIPTVAITLDASNNSIEDVTVQGFQNGVRLGANASAQNDLLKNISGGTSVTDVVFLTNVTGHTVSDITMLGIGNGGSATHTIQDSRTTPTTTISDATVAMYVLGEQLTGGSSNIGFSRFTTSPSVPTWSNGSGSPSNTVTCKLGALYSNTGGKSGSSNTWWVCSPAHANGCGTTPCWANIN